MATYTTIAGDTWDTIAYAQWEDEFKMTELMAANPEHLSTLVFGAGIVLTIPEIQTPAASTLPPWKQGQ